MPSDNISEVTGKDAQTQTPPSEENGEDLGALFEQRMNELDDEEKEFIAPFLTPEFAEVIRIVFEEEAGAFFKNLADPQMVLVPMPRAEVEAQIQQGQQTTQPQQAVQAPSVPSTQAPAQPV